MTAETDRSDGLALAPLGVADAERGFTLSSAIGWNQNAADWRYMLAHGFGWGRSDAAGRLVGTAMALPYGDFAWVCMVLVSPEARRRGIATELMGRVLDELERRGVVAGLDATPAGREVYRRLGFRDTYRVERLWAKAVAPAPPDETPARIAPMAESELAEIAAYDARSFGADRAALLRHLHGRAPRRAFVARIGEWPAGYVLARDGREALQVGPLVAEDPAIAVALASRALEGVRGEAVLDVPARHAGPIDWLKRSGFAFQRPYVRMLRGRDGPMDEPDYVFALAGPELG